MRGSVVDALMSAGDACEALAIGAYDVVILDLGLPDADGLDVLASARRGGKNMPILVLTARDAVEDRVRGLDAGADDYLVKPFATTELVARTKALLRRPGHALGTTLEAGNLLFDTIGRDVRILGETLALARQELSVLEHLMRRLGRVVPKVVLEEKLYGIDDELGSNAFRPCPSSPSQAHRVRRDLRDPYGARHRLSPRRRLIVMRWPRSLQAQLALRLTAVLLIAALVGVVALFRESDQTADALRREELLRRAEELTRLIERTPDGTVAVRLSPELMQVFSKPGATDLFVVRADGGGILATSRPDLAPGTNAWPAATLRSRATHASEISERPVRNIAR